MRVEPIQRGLELRGSLKQGDKILVADFSDTLQGKDTSRVVDLMPNVRTGEYVFRTKVNVKGIDPIAAPEYKVPYQDINKMSESEIEELIREDEFDFPLWFKQTPGFSMRRVLDYNTPFILQVAGCNFHDGSASGGCWYCFVDDASNDGKCGKGKTLLGTDETLDSMLAAREKIKGVYAPYDHDVMLKVLRVSGGEPMLALDWVLGLWRSAAKRMDIVGQLDTNLSTGVLVDEFERRGIFEPNILEKLSEYPVKVLTALKGTDEENLQSNVQSTATMAQQLYSLKRILKAGFDIYPQLYNPNPATLEDYLYDMEDAIDNFSLRVHIGPLKLYGPTRKRLTIEAERVGVNAEEFIAQKRQQWDKNYKRGCEILNGFLVNRYGLRYKEQTRADVKLKLRN
jgi:hypothetical protein